MDKRLAKRTALLEATGVNSGIPSNTSPNAKMLFTLVCSASFWKPPTIFLFYFLKKMQEINFLLFCFLDVF